MSHVSQLIQGHFFETVSEIDNHEDQVEERNSLRESKKERERKSKKERERLVNNDTRSSHKQL